MRPFIPILALFLVTSNLARAAHLIIYDPDEKKAFLSEVPAGSLTKKDKVCLAYGTAHVGCGTVLSVKPSEVIVLMEQVELAPIPDTEVAINVVGRSGTTKTTAQVSKALKKGGSDRTFGIAVGITAGTQYFYPNAHLQLVLGRNFAIGVMPMFAQYSTSSNSSVTGYGGFVTLSYYHTHSALRGLEFEIGGGYFSLLSKDSGTSLTASGYGGKFTIGWRGRAISDLGFDLGVAAGAQYIGIPTTDIDTSFHGILPLVSVYIGYSF